jgi:hypothetical protein
MRFQLIILVVLIVLRFEDVCLVAANQPSDPILAAATYDGYLLCLHSGGTVKAWDLKTTVYAKDTAAQLTRNGLICFATSGDVLWAADDAAVYQWSTKGRAWGKVADYDGRQEKLTGMVYVGGSLLLVFPSKVVDPVAKRTFLVPKLVGQGQGPPLRVLVVHGTDSMLWIGTGRGEWGGTLLGLDLKAGTWVHWHDGLHYVTGITHSIRGELVVSWSMNHFSANTLVRIHKPDATVKTEYPELDEKYYQYITYSRHDDVYYGVESTDLVTIKDGRPTKVAKLDGRLFVREPHAIGMAPGVIVLFPTGPKSVVIVPKWGQPWRLQREELTILQNP